MSEIEENVSVEKSGLQKILVVPVIGDILGFIFAFVPPVILTFVFIYLVGADENRYFKLVFSFLVFVWNLVLTVAFRLLITTPIIPIPIFLFAFGVFVYSIYEQFRY